MCGVDGSTVMDTIAAFETVRAAEPLSLPIVAVMVAFPTASDVAKPVVSILAMLPLLLVHTAD